MNEDDKKRFARYRPGYIEPPEPEESKNQDTTNIKPSEKNVKSEKVKDTLGFVEKIDVNPNDLIHQVINDMEQKEKEKDKDKSKKSVNKFGVHTSS